jgi:hypothetical protein
VPARKHVDDGVLSAQSSPLVSRSGKPIGMVSTHWAEPGRRLSECNRGLKPERNVVYVASSGDVVTLERGVFTVRTTPMARSP